MPFIKDSGAQVPKAQNSSPIMQPIVCAGVIGPIHITIWE